MKLFKVELYVVYQQSSSDGYTTVHVVAPDMAKALAEAKPSTGYATFRVHSITCMGDVQVVA